MSKIIKSQLEIERKFLLKAFPNKTPDDVIIIDQYYWKNTHGVWERARTFHSEKYGDKYIHTIKKSVNKYVNMETERELSFDEFEDFRKTCISDPTSKFILKKRYIYNEGDLKWEVDEFENGYRLIIAEVEIPNRRYNLTIPDYIQDVQLLEVTGNKKFSNRSLSLNIKDIDKYKN